MLAAIALGSNLPSAFGTPEETLREGIHRLTELGSVVAVSQLRITEPVGYLDQPQFVNGAALLETELSPLVLLRGLLGIERALGRNRAAGVPKGPRTLDLDLLTYGDEILADPELMLPHPSMHERTFVLEPLAEIAPELRHPVLHKTVSQLLASLA